MNTESAAVMALALGATALQTFEPGLPPLSVPVGVKREGHVLVLNPGRNEAGYVSSGPDLPYRSGRYAVEFYLRSGLGGSNVATVDVFDTNAGQIITLRQVGLELQPGRWTRVRLGFNLSSDTEKLSFRVHWPGAADLELASIRIFREK